MAWVACLSAVVFIIGASIIASASMSTGAALRYRDAKKCFYYSKALSKALTRDIEAMEYSDDDPWCEIAQGVYSAQIANGTAHVQDAVLDIELPDDAAFSGTAALSVTLKNQFLKPISPYVKDTSTGFEYMESTEIMFDMILELRVSVRDQDYLVYLKYNFIGNTLGQSEEEGSGKIVSGQFKYACASDAMPSE